MRSGSRATIRETGNAWASTSSLAGDQTIGYKTGSSLNRDEPGSVVGQHSQSKFGLTPLQALTIVGIDMTLPTDTTSLYMRSHGMGGTRLWFRILARLVRSSRGNWYTSHVDEHCFVTCVCGEGLSAFASSIYWCPKCHRGYTNVFETYTYPLWLHRLAKYADVPMNPETRKMLDEHYKKYDLR